MAPQPRVGRGGPANPQTKAVRKWLLKNGVEEEKLPDILQDGVVARTKKGPVGAIVVRNISGLVKNNALRVVRQFEENVGGKEEVADKLSVLPDLPEESERLIGLIRGGGKKSLATLMAEAGAEPMNIMRQYARGCVELGLVNVAIEAHRNLPRLVKDLYAHALDKECPCRTCVGSGMVKAHANYQKDTMPCPECEGTGKSLVSSKHKEFATGKLLEVTKLTEKGNGVTVNVAQVNASAGGGGFMEKMLLMSDAVLYPKPTSGEIVEAEIVPPSDHSA